MTVELNPRDPGFLSDPHSPLRAVRAEDPVHWCAALNAWILTRYGDAKRALNDPRLSADRISPFRDSLTAPKRERIADLLRTLGDWMVFADPPKHTRLRRAANRAFPPRAMDDMEPRVIRIVDDLLGRIALSGETDLIREFGFPLPVLVIADMMGVPAADQDRFKAWSDELATFVGSAQLTPDKRDRAQEAALSMADYFRHAVALRRAEPRRDRLTALIEAAEETGDMSEDELIATCVLLLFAGHETTTNLIGNGMLSLLRNRSELDRLAAHPDAIEPAVEELLRYEGPTMAMTRIALEDVRYGGREMRRHDRIFIMLPAANRDPAVFDDADRLDIGREPNRHLTFGYGRHFCIGAPLARLEGRIALRALLTRFTDLRLTEPEPRWVDSLSLRGVHALPMSLRPVTAAHTA